MWRPSGTHLDFHFIWAENPIFLLFFWKLKFNQIERELEEMEDKTKLMSTKGLLQSQELYEYILETNVYPRELEPLKEIRDITANHPRYFNALVILFHTWDDYSYLKIAKLLLII